MIAPLRTRLLAGAAPLVGLLLFAASADAYLTEISGCTSNVVHGRGRLVKDLDCSGSSGYNVVIERGTLDLAGHTLVIGELGYAIHCVGNCKIVGPGTIVGAGSAIIGERAVRVVDVDITMTTGGFGGIGVAANGNLVLDGVTIGGGAIGAITDRNAKLIDSTITADWVGVLAGGSNAGTPCELGALLMRRSSVTGTDPAICVGADPPANCVDILSCKPPKLSASTCGTSCQGGTGAPCTSWGVCSGD